MTKIYLAGLISTDKPASLEWRELIKAVKDKWEFLDPMRGKQNLVKTSKDGGITDPALTSKDIIYRDYADIRSADVFLVCLDDFGSNRPLVGTLFELAWAWEHKIPVVAFGATPLMENHPFVKEAVCHYCKTLAEATDILGRHYVRV